MRPCGTYFDQKNISNKHRLLFSLGLKFLKLSVKDILATGLLYIYKIFVQVYFVGYVNWAHFFFIMQNARIQNQVLKLSRLTLLIC